MPCIFFNLPSGVPGRKLLFWCPRVIYHYDVTIRYKNHYSTLQMHIRTAQLYLRAFCLPSHIKNGDHPLTRCYHWNPASLDLEANAQSDRSDPDARLPWQQVFKWRRKVSSLENNEIVHCLFSACQPPLISQSISEFMMRIVHCLKAVSFANKSIDIYVRIAFNLYILSILNTYCKVTLQKPS